MYSDLISALASSSDNKSVLAVLDMTAAFDTVDHSILLQRLERWSLRQCIELVHLIPVRPDP